MIKALSEPNRIRQTRDWFPAPSARKSFALLKLPRQQFGKMVQFLTGHNFLNYHEFLVHGDREEVDLMCELCDYNYVQTSAHIIGECPSERLMELRKNLFGFHLLEPPFLLPLPAVFEFLQLAEIEAFAMDADEGAKNHTS